MGLRVPAGFAIVDATPDRLPDDLADRYRGLGGGPVAVRSSALDEDGHEASWAGQYETLLGVEGEEALAEAVCACLRSLESERASAYHDSRHRAGENAMCVVVQRMVDARAAGVLFTVDPVTSRRARVVIDAVEGLGEALVSGESTPDHYLLDREGRTRVEERQGTRAVLDNTTRRRLLAEALEAEADRGEPLDLEWAIDGEGRTWWLQARPITTLVADMNELDTPLRDATDVFTRCNIGEMFPGACTPLSYSFTARGVDVGMQMMHRRVGIQSGIHPYMKTVSMFYGHLFLNLTAVADTATQALGSSSDQMCLSLCGRRISEPEIKLKPAPPLTRRISNGLRYIRYLLGQRSARRGMRDLVASLDLTAAAGSALDQWRVIDAKFDAIFRAMDFHLISSAGAGALNPTLLGVIAGGEDPSDRHHAEVAALLAGAENVESADIAAGAVRILDEVMRQGDSAPVFANTSLDDARSWLEGEASGSAGQEYRRYLERHGHRAIKELELRQPEWREDPLPLLASLQASTRARLVGRDAAAAESVEPQAPVDPLRGHGRVVRWLTKLARQTVRSREETKSGLVKLTTVFKVAYRELGRRATAEGLLPDPDAVFFLTQEELGRLVADAEPELAEVAAARREILPLQDALQFPDVFAGEPEPLDPELSGDPADKIVTGNPVSRGKVTGIARVVRTPEEAEALCQGEILVAPITDVGWTPYFSMIAGLVTDIGSAVSHGAVVAREFGLPAVVNTRIGTQVFESGDRITLDADIGVVSLAEEPD